MTVERHFQNDSNYLVYIQYLVFRSTQYTRRLQILTKVSMANPENNFSMQGFIFGEVYSSTEYTCMNRALCGPIWKFRGTHHLPSSESPGERNEAKPAVGSEDDHIPSVWYFLLIVP